MYILDYPSTSWSSSDDPDKASIAFAVSLSPAGNAAALTKQLPFLDSLTGEVTPTGDEEHWATFVALLGDPSLRPYPINAHWSSRAEHLRPTTELVGNDFEFEDVWYRPRVVVEAVSGPCPVDDAPSTFEQLIELERGTADERAAAVERAEAQAAEVSEQWLVWWRKFLIRASDTLVEWQARPHHNHAPTGDTVDRLASALAAATGCAGRKGGDLKQRDAQDAAIDAWLAARESQEERRGAAAARRQREEFVEAAAAWIGEHGSSHLRKAAEADMVGRALSIYRSERLAAELPGWRFQTRDDELKDALNPTEHQLDRLLRARQEDGHVHLHFLKEVGIVLVRPFLDSMVLIPVPDDEEPF